MSASNSEEFLKGFWKENPIFVYLLGMCPTLAVSNSVINSVSMGLATTFVLVMSSTLISMLRKVIPSQVRIAAYIMIIATFVTVVDYVIQAISLDLYKALGAFISLIVVNCIILGRAESFASRNPVWPSILDALGSGLGFTFAIFLMGMIRELLGNGSFAGIDVFGPSFEPWIVMILPGGGFFVLGALLLGVNAINTRRRRVRP
ncbi:MAG: electron transport complex subunit E [Calditrichaeota bacterium]|nr:electron transport complex subunit E [Calditrichota bacterium]MCB9473910.1 electron transport complex subunit E [Candidatus Delongbacteria bacterium]